MFPCSPERRGYASDATPPAARVLAAAAAEGQNEILLRLLQAAPAFKEHAIGFTAPRFGDMGSALDYSITAGNVVGAALFMGSGSGMGAGRVGRPGPHDVASLPRRGPTSPRSGARSCAPTCLRR